MNVLITYNDKGWMHKSAAALDNKRLLKQIVEVFQITKAIEYNEHGLDAPWDNHCVTNLWRNFPVLLTAFGIVCDEEWQKRGFKQVDITFPYYSQAILHKDSFSDLRSPIFATDSFIFLMRQHLVAKDEEHYKKFFPDTKPIPGYYGRDSKGTLRIYSRPRVAFKTNLGKKRNKRT